MSQFRNTIVSDKPFSLSTTPQYSALYCLPLRVLFFFFFSVLVSFVLILTYININWLYPNRLPHMSLPLCPSLPHTPILGSYSTHRQQRLSRVLRSPIPLSFVKLRPSSKCHFCVVAKMSPPLLISSSASTTASVS